MAKNGVTTLKITDIPGEVLSHNLLPLLQPNDVVRLRRVCKKLKSVADDHLRLHVRNKRILHIAERHNENEEYESDGNQRRDQPTSIKHLLGLKCHLPVSKLSLNFGVDSCQESIFENDEWKMHEFLEKYGKQITHLTMSTISMPMINQKEIAFYEGLSNLTHLTITDVQSDGEIWGNEEQEEYHFPTTFRNLKHLAVHLVNICQQGNENELPVRKYLWTLVEFCSNLETFVYPYFDFIRIHIENRNLVSFSFNHLGNLLGNGKLQKLKAYHLTSVFEQELSAMGGPIAFAEFCHLCNKYNVKLHVRSKLLDGLNDATILERVGRSIVSLMCEDISSLKATLPNLEYLHLCLYDDDRTNWNGIAPVWPWPNLKRLIFHYSAFISSDSDYSYPGPDTLDMIFHILFEATRRPSVKSLELFSVGDHRYIPPQMLRNVAWSCFNLTTVEIINWSGTNEEFSSFWGQLPLLEEVHLSACQALGDSGFIGENVNEPVFLGLKNLRKLSLRHMHEMTITDVLFKLVIRHLQLREFYISSWRWGYSDSDNLLKIHSITKEGIKSLLTSNFAQSIERFPFDSWMLSDMSSEEFLQLGDQFRSSHML